jgi:hypothetical protein
MKTKLAISALMLSIFFAISISAINAQAQTEDEEESTEKEDHEEHSETEMFVVRDSATIMLGFKTLQSGDYIHLYDATPYMIVNGHVAAKLPCDENSETPLSILIGSAPDLSPADLELVSELSVPGKACLYHADLESDDEHMVTDIAVQNPTDKSIRFPSTSTVVIGVNEIASMGEHGHNE